MSSVVSAGAASSVGGSCSSGQTQQTPQHQHDQQLPPHSSDPDVELPRVLLALRTVYAPNAAAVSSCSSVDGGSGGNTPFDRRDVADRYLTSFQRAPVAWVVCDRLLSSSSTCGVDGSSGPGAPCPASQPPSQQGEAAPLAFFAAQTLHAKCRCDVDQLPPESLPSLRESLLRHFCDHAADSVRAAAENRPPNRPLVTRLGMALASLAVQMSWTTILRDAAADVLGSRPELGPAVLELFRSVPEEACSDKLSLGPAKGGESALYAYRDHLRASAGVVLDLCERAVYGGDGEVRAGRDVATAGAVLSCLQSWVGLGFVDPALLERSALVPWAFELLADPSRGCFEMAVDNVVELLRMYPSHNRGNEGLVRAIVPRVMALAQEQGQAVVVTGAGVIRSPFQKSIDEEDEDGMRGYCRIFTEMGEAYLSLILSHEEMNQQALVELVLCCSGIPDNEIAGITLHFWYRFVMGLEDLQPYEYRQIKIDSFAPQLARLLTVCQVLLRYPPDIDDLSPDRIDDLESSRLYLADTIEDCCRLLGGEAVLRSVGDQLQEECRRVASLPPHCQLAEWHGIEAHIYAAQAISPFVPGDEPRVVPFVLGLIPQLPPEVPLLRATANLTVGKYASWLRCQPAHLQPLLPYLAHGLSIPRCAPSSAVAIREICERCDSLGDAVLQLYDGILAARERHRGQRAAGGAGVGGGEEFVLDLRDELEVLEGVCKSVSYKLRDASAVRLDAANVYLNRLARPIIGTLAAMAAPEGSPSPKQISSEICRLTVLVQHLRLPRPSPNLPPEALTRPAFLLSLMKEVWPLLDAVIQKYPRDFNCCEKLCRLHKHALRECGTTAYAPMLEPLIHQIIQNFSMSLLSPYLYLASICTSEYGRNPAHSQQLFDMVANLSSNVFSVLRTPDDFTSNPDVVEEFFFMTGRVVTYCPGPLVRSALLHSLLQCAALGMQLHHKDANRGTLNFLECTVKFAIECRMDVNQRTNQEALEQAILKEGQPLVTNLAQALLGDLPAYRLDSGSGSVAGVLFNLNKLCPELLLQWIEPPLVSAPDRAKSAFLQSLVNRVSRDEFNLSVRTFTSVCERSRKQGGTGVSGTVGESVKA